jgi:hypothetical protein
LANYWNGLKIVISEANKRRLERLCGQYPDARQGRIFRTPDNLGTIPSRRSRCSFLFALPCGEVNTYGWERAKKTWLPAEPDITADLIQMPDGGNLVVLVFNAEIGVAAQTYRSGAVIVCGQPEIIHIHVQRFNLGVFDPE